MKTRTPHLLLLVTGRPVAEVEDRRGGFEDLFRDGLGESATLQILDVTPRAEGDPLPDLDTYDGLLVSGSPSMVDEDLAWMRWTTRALRAAVEAGLPTLAVCFGHQLLARAYGADVGPNPNGYEVGTHTIHVDAPGDPLLGALGPTVEVNLSHRDAVRAPSPAMRVLARAPHDGCQAFALSDRAWGVQFHPEFDADVVRAYVRARREVVDTLRGPGAADTRLAAARQTPDALGLLRRFAHLCATGR